MKVPQHELAIVPVEKITEYLLNLEHPVGQSKAIFFFRFGFTLEEWEMLAQALMQHVAEYEFVNVRSIEDGELYSVEGAFHTPDQRNPYVRSIWFVKFGEEIPRFTSAYPVKKKRG